MVQLKNFTLGDDNFDGENYTEFDVERLVERGDSMENFLWKLFIKNQLQPSLQRSMKQIIGRWHSARDRIVASE